MANHKILIYFFGSLVCSSVIADSSKQYCLRSKECKCIPSTTPQLCIDAGGGPTVFDKKSHHCICKYQ